MSTEVRWDTAGKLSVRHNVVDVKDKGALRKATHPPAILHHQSSRPMPHPGGSTQQRTYMIGRAQQVLIVQFRPCGITVSMGIYDRLCTVIWHDQYRGLQRQTTSAQPKKYSYGIVKGIEWHRKGGRRFNWVEFGCASFKIPLHGLLLPDTRKIREYTIITVT